MSKQKVMKGAALLFILMFIGFLAKAQNGRGTSTIPNANPKLKKEQIMVNPATDKADHYVKPADEQFNRGNWDSGKVIVEEGLKKYPKYADLKMLLGKYWLHFNKYDQARYELKKALEYDPNNLDAKNLLVNLETETKRYSSAICYVNELLQVQPYWKGLWEKKISLYILQGNLIEANRLQKRLLQIYPDDKAVKKELLYNTELEATRQSKAGNIDAAIDLHKNILQEGGKNVRNYLSIINEYLKAGDDYNALAYTVRGLAQFPQDRDLINKKAGILASQKRYDELLPFLKSKGMERQYNYYLLQAARNAKDQDPTELYGKILSQDPGNEEAFNYVFTKEIAEGQYQEALLNLKRYTKIHGNSKQLSVSELNIYKKMKDVGKIHVLTKSLFKRYPSDRDLRADYVSVMSAEAKDDMDAASYSTAVQAWYQVLQFGDSAQSVAAQYAIYTANLTSGHFNEALNSLNELIGNDVDNPNLYVKQADLYFQIERYYNAIQAYKKAIQLVDVDSRSKLIEDFGEMQTKMIKILIDKYDYNTALDYDNEWLAVDSNNKIALHYAINLSHLMRNDSLSHIYAQKGYQAFPDDPYFNAKVAEVNGQDKTNLDKIYENLLQNLRINSFDRDLLNVLSVTAGKLGIQLIHQHKAEDAIQIVDSALFYSPSDSSLKYVKGLAFEQLRKFDSAFVYQSYHRPSFLEEGDFKRHIKYLGYRSNKNEIVLSHLRSRFGDSYTIQTLSSVEFNKFKGDNTYSGLVNYAGRESGKGYQLQFQWLHNWDPETHTLFNFAWANQFFPSFTLNVGLFKQINLLGGTELGLGLGYRRLDTTVVNLNGINSTKNMSNLALGLTKEWSSFRLNLKVDNFILGNRWLYNISFDGRYYMSTPKDYVMTVASVGTSPNVTIIDYNLYNGFSALNTMVGLGIGRLIYKNVSASLLGTCINFRTDGSAFKNLYNVYLNLNVAF